MRLPFQPLDKAFLAGTRAPWASFAPVWRLDYRGPLTPEQLGLALRWVVARYPSCAARVVALDGSFDTARQFAWELPEVPQAPEVTVLDLRGLPPDEAAAREAALADRFLDLEREAPLQCTWVQRSDDEGSLAFQQHHALADGRAFLSLLGDFIQSLHAAAGGATASPLPPDPVKRRPELEAVEGRGWWVLLVGAWLFFVESLRALLSPLTPLRSNTGTDYGGANRTRHLLVPVDRLERWREARGRLGLSTNDLLAGALCAALARWSARHGYPPGRHMLFMPIDVRPRGGTFESFANHLSSIQLRWRGRADAQPVQLAQALHAAAAPLLSAATPARRVRFDGALVRAVPIGVLRRALLDTRRLITSISFSNLIPLGTPGAAQDGRWRFGAAVVEGLRITTPCTPPQGLNATVARYGDSLCFNFNFKASAVPAELVDELAVEFARCLEEVDVTLGA